MQIVTAAHAKAKLGEMLDNSQLEPVIITKNGREFAVVMSSRRYKLLQELEERLENEYLVQRDLEAESVRCGAAFRVSYNFPSRSEFRKRSIK